MPLPTKRNQDFLEKGLILWLGKRKSETCPEHSFVPEGKKRAQGIRGSCKNDSRVHLKVLPEAKSGTTRT